MKSAAVAVTALLMFAGCNRPLRTAGLVTAGALVAGGIYISADTPDCQPTEPCLDLGGESYAAMVMVSGVTLALVSLIASEVANAEPKQKPAPAPR